MVCLGALVVFGCGGSDAQPETPASVEAAPAASPEPAPAPEPAAAKGADENWEGEADAKNAAGPAEGKPAPPDTKKEETRTSEVIAKVVKDNRQKFRDCYDKAQKDLPTLKGDMVLTFVLDPARTVSRDFMDAEIDGLIAWVKSSAAIDPDVPVLVAGEPERIARARRAVEGIPIDDTTWSEIRDAAARLQVRVDAA